MSIKEIYYIIIHKAKNNRLLYAIIHSYRKKRASIRFKKSLKNFHKNGYEAMRLFDKCMCDNNHPYSVAFGTLLGVIRNHDFIPHDDDIDVAMWINEFSPNLVDDLVNSGFSLHHSFSINDDKIGKELTFEYKGVLIDIFFFYQDANQQSYCCDFIFQPGCSSISESVYRYGGMLPRKLYIPLNESLERSTLRDIEVSIPTNYSDILTCRYGADYMIPKPGWRPTTSSIIELRDYIGIVK